MEDVSKMVVTEEIHVAMARDFYLHQKRGVMFLSDKFSIGVDVKCGNDAAVLVFVDNLSKIPDRESLT